MNASVGSVFLNRQGLRQQLVVQPADEAVGHVSDDADVLAAWLGHLGCVGAIGRSFYFL